MWEPETSRKSKMQREKGSDGVPPELRDMATLRCPPAELVDGVSIPHIQGCQNNPCASRLWLSLPPWNISQSKMLFEKGTWAAPCTSELSSLRLLMTWVRLKGSGWDLKDRVWTHPFSLFPLLPFSPLHHPTDILAPYTSLPPTSSPWAMLLQQAHTLEPS